MKYKNEDILILFFESARYGEVRVKIRRPSAQITMKNVRIAAGVLIRTWRSKKGVRLKAFRRAILIRRGAEALPEK